MNEFIIYPDINSAFIQMYASDLYLWVLVSVEYSYFNQTWMSVHAISNTGYLVDEKPFSNVAKIHAHTLKLIHGLNNIWI